MCCDMIEEIWFSHVLILLSNVVFKVYFFNEFREGKILIFSGLLLHVCLGYGKGRKKLLMGEQEL